MDPPIQKQNRVEICQLWSEKVDFLAKKKFETVPHPPYSPDLAPNDFFLYPKAKKHLKSRLFESTSAAVKALEAILKRLAKNGFQHVFEEWQKRWKKCIALQSDYIEREKVEID